MIDIDKLRVDDEVSYLGRRWTVVTLHWASDGAYLRLVTLGNESEGELTIRSEAIINFIRLASPVAKAFWYDNLNVGDTVKHESGYWVVTKQEHACDGEHYTTIEPVAGGAYPIRFKTRLAFSFFSGSEKSASWPFHCVTERVKYQGRVYTIQQVRGIDPVTEVTLRDETTQQGLVIRELTGGFNIRHFLCTAKLLPKERRIEDVGTGDIVTLYGRGWRVYSISRHGKDVYSVSLVPRDAEFACDDEMYRMPFKRFCQEAKYA